ncbi:MAG: DnaA regulatory inactivator Hda [Gammaproteobacteria bacterium 39-13]|nr:DnaA regulatory inactivator Hda [Gammaproteobacteria bacterium]OJV86168.1 MAG: DnaA regulatory inactivator Hda [Gammaproteobacteria bacterium 39-13]
MNKDLIPKQLPLSIDLRDDCTLETFYAGSNHQVLDQIKLSAQGIGEQFIFLWGREGVGRSHLLQGACHFAGRQGITAVYLPLLDLLQREPTKLVEGLERLGLVCIDDIDAICGQPIWEEALFYLFNRLRTANHRLIIAANVPPKSLPLKLADLQSRFSWGVTYQIQPLDDEQLIAALQLRAKQRGLELSKDVGAFLIRRFARDMPHLYALLDQLDKASLAAQRRLTIPFVKSVLSL